MSFRTQFALVLSAGLAALGSSPARADEFAAGVTRLGEHAAAGPKSFLRDYAPRNSDGWINVVVESPTGTTAKWKVTKCKGILKRRFKAGKPKVVEYLAYPGNYGMLPRTVVRKDSGENGGAIDVIVLSNPVPRGSIIKAKVIGILELKDKGERDDKIIAVTKSSPFAGIDNPEQMKARFPGVLKIVKTWFEGYKGPSKMKSIRYLGPVEANRAIDAAEANFKKVLPFDKLLSVC